MTVGRPIYKPKDFALPPRLGWLAGRLQSCAGILAANWLMQGVRGMGRKELSFRLLIEAVAAVILTSILSGLGAGVGTAGLAAALVAHTLSWLVNGQLWVCVRYCPAYCGSRARLDRALDDLATILPRLGWLDEAALIGSAAERRHGERGDIDLRLVFPPGIVAWLRTNLLLLRLRSRALVRMVPLDLYAHDGLSALRGCAATDTVRLLVDRHGRLRQTLADRRIVP